MDRFDEQPRGGRPDARSLAASREKSEPEESGRMGKERVAKDDGRYIIFYSFEGNGDSGEDS